MLDRTHCPHSTPQLPGSAPTLLLGPGWYPVCPQPWQWAILQKRRDFLGSPVVRTQGFQSLVGKLRSHKPYSMLPQPKTHRKLHQSMMPTCSNTNLDVTVKVSVKVISTYNPLTLSKGDCPSQCGWASHSQSKALRANTEIF